MALESLVLTGKTRWLFLVSWRALQMRTRHVENARRIRSSAIWKHSCIVLRRLLNEDGAIVFHGGDEGLLLDRDE